MENTAEQTTTANTPVELSFDSAVSVFESSPKVTSESSASSPEVTSESPVESSAEVTSESPVESSASSSEVTPESPEKEDYNPTFTFISTKKITKIVDGKRTTETSSVKCENDKWFVKDASGSWQSSTKELALTSSPVKSLENFKPEEKKDEEKKEEEKKEEKKEEEKKEEEKKEEKKEEEKKEEEKKDDCDCPSCKYRRHEISEEEAEKALENLKTMMALKMLLEASGDPRSPFDLLGGSFGFSLGNPFRPSLLGNPFRPSLLGNSFRSSLLGGIPIVRRPSSLLDLLLSDEK
ncbi:Hypothetical protein HVR_LOCUS647 [uncultured virus]|nr:Hypothetical protein HVR_LOCUS647 [uncultured virus]